MVEDDPAGNVIGGRTWCIGVHMACITSGGRLSNRIIAKDQLSSMTSYFAPMCNVCRARDKR